MSRPFRNNHNWPLAAWTPAIDDAIKSIATDDQSQPRNERRVLIEPNEIGAGLAPDHVAANPDQVQQIYASLTAADAHSNFPVGVVEKARRNAGNPTAVVTDIVRDAYNHDAALAAAFSRTPFMLAPREAAFNQLLEGVRATSPVQFPRIGSPQALTPGEVSELTSEVLRVLDLLESSHDTPSLEGFMRSGGQRLLAEWMAQNCESLGRTGATSIQGEIAARLLQEFDQNRLDDDWSSIFVNLSSVTGGAGLAWGIADPLAQQQLDIYGGVGLALGLFPVGYQLAQKVGLVDNRYRGHTQWAFLYAFGNAPSRRGGKKLRKTLDRLR